MSTIQTQYSSTEEIANTITHGLGALLSVAALTLLVSFAILQNDILRITSFAIYGASLVILFLASTLYHAFSEPKLKKFFKLFDHCAIYLLIAGTYTPLMLVTLNGTLGYLMLGVIWLLAFAGIAYKLINRNKQPLISLATYLGMGCILLTCMESLLTALSTHGLKWLIAGGLFYALGIIFYVGKRIPFNHAIWHLFVLAGAACHFFMMWFYV